MRCGETRGTAKGHTWKEATCEEPETCTVCGKTQGTAKGHTWKAATCTVPKTCSVCGKTEGEALGHTPGEVEMGEPDYVLATVWLNTKCTVCGEIEDRELKELKYLYEDGKFIPSIDEFTERLGKLYPYADRISQSRDTGKTRDFISSLTRQSKTEIHRELESYNKEREHL